jgi:hypothetical protein
MARLDKRRRRVIHRNGNPRSRRVLLRITKAASRLRDGPLQQINYIFERRTALVYM